MPKPLTGPRFLALAALLAGATLVGGPASAAIVLGSLGSAYTQDFDTLASTGSASTLPPGWALSETGTNANSTYTAGTGSSNAGDTYSFGTATSGERALGMLRSGSLVPTIGVSFDNGTGSVITELALGYTGEQWRVGALGRNDRVDFQYSLDATSLSTGIWTDVDALDFLAPVTAGTVRALDGNAAANRAAIGASIGGLNIASGAGFWLRWTDFQATSADDGLAIDDFSLIARGNSVPEPGSLALAGLALFAVTALRRRSRG